MVEGIRFLFPLLVAASAASAAVSELRTEFLETPVGLHTTAPRFSWKMDDDRTGAAQAGYQILVSSSRANLDRDLGDLWDSGPVDSSESHLVSYGGSPLVSRRIGWWKVRIRDERGELSPWSKPASFELGLLSAEDWKAKWIGSELSPINNSITERWLRHLLREDWTEAHRGRIPDLYRELEPTPRFRRSFPLDQDVVSARLYISGLGCYTARLNGKRVGDYVMAPAQTDYDRRIFYDIFDVTSLLRRGENTLAVELGDGWYHQHVPKIGFEEYGKPVLRAQLEITTAEGRREVIATGDGKWKTAPGPTLKNDLHTGEVYDARLEQTGWDVPGFDDSRWALAGTVDPLLPKGLGTPSGETPVMIAQLLQPERRSRTIRPVRLTHPKNGVWVFHFAERISGRLLLRVNDLPAGTPLVLRVGETLREEKCGKSDAAIAWYDELEGTRVDEKGRRTGDFDGLPASPQAAHIWTRPDARGQEFQAHVIPTSLYVTRGGGLETWENEYSHQSFQFVELIGYPEGREPALDTVQAVVVHTDAPRAGSFSASDNLLNTFDEMFRRTFLSCFHGTLGDNPGCERSPWFGDNVTGLDGAYYHADMICYLRKWIGDIQTTMGIRGQMWQTAPGKRSDGGRTPPAWAVPCILLPWHAWIYYGDEEILKDHYSFMRQCADFYVAKLDGKHIWRGFGYGDWGDVNTAMIDKKDGQFPRGNTSGNNMPLNSKVAFTETAALYDGVNKLSAIAAHLGRSEDAEHYRDMAGAMREGLNSPEFYDATKKTYGSQAANALAVQFGFAPADDVPAILDWIHGDIGRQGGHFTVGSYTLPYLLRALSDHGRIEDAWTVMTSPGYPGFRHMVDTGSSTVWAMWDGNTRSPDKHATVRCNQHPYADSGSLWLYHGLGGIKCDPASPGRRQLILRPGVPAAIESVSAETATPYGRVVSAWKRSPEQFAWRVKVPPNSTATAHVPLVFGEKSVVRCGAGIVLSQGKPATKVPGASFQEIRGGEAVFELKSGDYRWDVSKE